MVVEDVGPRDAPVLRECSVGEKVSDLQYHPHEKRQVLQCLSRICTRS